MVKEQEWLVIVTQPVCKLAQEPCFTLVCQSAQTFSLYASQNCEKSVSIICLVSIIAIYFCGETKEKYKFDS